MRQRVDTEGREMNGIKMHDVKDTKKKEKKFKNICFLL